MPRPVMALIVGATLLSGGVGSGVWPDRAAGEAAVWLVKSASRSKAAPLTYKVVGIFQPGQAVCRWFGRRRRDETGRV